MANNICTRFYDDNGVDIGCDLISKEFMIENYPSLVSWAKAPALWVWGNSSNFVLGDGFATDRSSPVQTISTSSNWKSVSAGGCHSAAIKTDGTLWLWGNTFSTGAIGNNVSGIIQYSSPVQTISGGTNWKQISMGDVHSTAIKTDGTLWLWGQGFNGELANNASGNTIRISSPIQTISAGTNWKQVSASNNITAAIKTDGTLWLWGSNAIVTPLGDNARISRSSPIQTISAGTNWKTVSMGHFHATAIKQDGTLWTWGSNCGALGNNSLLDVSSPIQTISAGTNWKQVSAGRFNTAAIKTDGSLWLWGNNVCGQLGDNTNVSKSSPVQTVSGGTNWQSVNSGNCIAGGIKTDGSLWLWGNSSSGQLGNNTNTPDKSSPVQTIMGGNDWRQVSFSAIDALPSGHVMAINDGGDY